MTACISSQVGRSPHPHILRHRKTKTHAQSQRRPIYQGGAGKAHAEERQANASLYKHCLSMGMANPANYAEVIKLLKITSSPDGLGMSPRRITVSNSGRSQNDKTGRR